MSTSNPARRLLVLAVTASIVAAGVLAILAASAGAKSNTIAIRTAKVAGHSERVAVNCRRPHRLHAVGRQPQAHEMSPWQRLL